MSVVSYLWTRCIYTQLAQRSRKELLAAQSAIKKTAKGLPAAYEGERKQPHPFQQLQLILYGVAPYRRGFIRSFESPESFDEKAMELIRQRRSTVVRRTSDISVLGQPYEERERGGSRDVCAVKVGAENVPSGAIYNLLLHARTADERGEPCGLFGGNSLRGAIDPTAARQDAAVHVANESNPAGHGDSGDTKTCGAIRGEAGAALDRGRERWINLSEAGPIRRDMLFFDLRG
ncbi:hypothetical protein TcYC6_0052090 [Trypanosoma cruzi]|nr:hypothetical protein TcYC6_0052090 [Trypanosoma cruzi]